MTHQLEVEIAEWIAVGTVVLMPFVVWLAMCDARTHRYCRYDNDDDDEGEDWTAYDAGWDASWKAGVAAEAKPYRDDHRAYELADPDEPGPFDNTEGR